MQIIVNDKPHGVETGTTLGELLQKLDVEPKYVAVECNLQLVPRADHDACVLRPGDRLEIVTLVGGG